MITISLHGAEFFAYHGVYPEEQILGCKFIVDVEVDFVPSGPLREDEIVNTVDYGQLYRIAEEQMHHTRKLIETAAQGIADQIKAAYPFVDKIRVSIKKLNPALKGRVEYSSAVITI